MKRRRRVDKQNEQIMELNQVLEPYVEQPWDENASYESEYEGSIDNAPQAYAEPYAEYDGEEYSEAHEEADMESRFRLAIGMFDLISIIIGVAVILVLAGMLITLFNWLRNDILHSALFLQSGLM